MLLLSGWLLMRPPFVRDKQGRYDPYADELPLSRWEQVASFEREDECEKTRQANREKTDKALAAAADHTTDGKTGLSDYDVKLADYYRALFARCLTAEHVHPPVPGVVAPGGAAKPAGPSGPGGQRG